MTSMRTLRDAVALGVIGTFSLVPQPPLAARRLARTGDCIPPPQYRAGLTTCYLPAYVAVAEQRIPLRPINPVAAVAGIVHLPLSRVVVFHGGGRGPAPGIVYVFGTLTQPSCGARRCAYAIRYVLVQETLGHGTGNSIMTTTDTTFGPGPGPWAVQAYVSSRNLFLRVTLNQGGAMTRQIGHRLIQAA